MNIHPSDSDAYFEDRKATPLPSSAGKEQMRLSFRGLDDAIAQFATKKLSQEESKKDPSQIRLGFLDRLRFKAIQVSKPGGQKETVLVNIRSVTKRLLALGATKQEIESALKSGSLDQLVQKLAPVEKNLEKLAKGRLPPEQIEKVKQFVRKYRNETNVYYKGSHEGLGHGVGIQFSEKGHIYIVLTKQSLGSGSFKVVRPVIDLAKGQFQASPRIRGIERTSPEYLGEINKELQFLEEYQQDEGIVRLYHTVRYVGVQKERGGEGILVNKISPIVERYECDLDSIVKRNIQLPDAVWKKMLAKVAGFFAKLHQAGKVHGDIKPANILINSRTRKAAATDFGTVCKPSELSIEDFRGQGTPFYIPPEYAHALRQGSNALIKEATTDKLDVWSFGVTLYQLFCSQELPWVKARDPIKAIAMLKEGWLKEPTDPLEHLIWEMLSVDPRRRPSMAVVQQHLLALSS